jgi:NAD(P)-dependent dehydrogenase (short-subunit alcohol dehydrogenase family)
MTNHQGPVALFTGATAGIGEAILKAYAEQHPNACIYFVGRKEASAKRIIEDVRQIWTNAPGRTGGEGEITFMKIDLTLLKNVQSIVEEITGKRGHDRLDLLCMSQGYLTLKGREGRL